MTAPKKLFTVFAALIIAILSLMVFTSCKGDVPPAPELHIAIITDTHVVGENQIGDINSQSFINFNAGAHKMLHVSEAVFKSALDEIILTKPDVLFIAGDITEDGGHLSHRAVAANLEKVKNAGIKVFIIPGNHDIREGRTHTAEGTVAVASTTFEDFKSIYANFGYSNTRSTYEGSLSYSADISPKYRLIAIDANIYTYDEQNRPRSTGSSAMPKGGLLDWAVNEVKQAVADGKTPLAMMHFPVMQHFGELIEKVGIFDSTTLGENTNARAELAKAGLKYIFTGHMHLQSVSLFEEDNNKLYDITTSSLPNHPMPIRHFKVFSDDIEITTQTLKNIKEQYIPSYIAEEERAAIKADFQKYAYSYTDESMGTKILRKADAELILKVMGLLGVKAGTSGAEELAIDINQNFLAPLINIKLYNKDKIGNELTVEYIAGLYGAEMPATEYKTLLELALSYMKGVFAGDGGINISEPRFTALKYSIYSAFYFIDDYGLFTKLHELNSSVKTVELKGISEELFKTGKMPLDKNGILGLVIGILKDKISMLSNIDESKLDGKGLVALLSMFQWEKLDYSFGIPVQIYLDAETGSILLGKFLDDILSDFFTASGPPSNNLKINRVTLEYSAL